VEPFSRERNGDRLFLISETLSVLPLVSTLLLVAVTTLVTKDGVDEKTEEHRSDVPVSEIHALLRGSDRQLLKRGRGGFGVLPGDQVQMPSFIKARTSE